MVYRLSHRATTSAEGEPTMPTADTDLLLRPPPPAPYVHPRLRPAQPAKAKTPAEARAAFHARALKGAISAGAFRFGLRTLASTAKRSAYRKSQRARLRAS